MFPMFTDVIAALDDLKAEGIIQEYAIFGAIAHTFWEEAISTFDLDILVQLSKDNGGLISLDPLYKWAASRNYRTDAEHIYIGQIPVQFVPAPSPLEEEAIQTAATLSSDGASVRVVRREYLIAQWLKPPANSASRKDRARRLSESPDIDHELLAQLMQRSGLSW